MSFLKWLTADHPDSPEAIGKVQLVCLGFGIILFIIEMASR